LDGYDQITGCPYRALGETARKNEPSDGLVIIRNIVYPGEGHAVLEGMKLPDGGFIARPAGIIASVY
jgi:hypothetical protein